MRNKSFSAKTAEELDAQLDRFLEFSNKEDWKIHHINRGFFQWKHNGEMVTNHYAHVAHEAVLTPQGGEQMEEQEQQKEEEKVEAQAPEAAPEAPAEAPVEEAPAEQAEAPAEEEKEEAPAQEKKEESDA